MFSGYYNASGNPTAEQVLFGCIYLFLVQKCHSTSPIHWFSPVIVVAVSSYLHICISDKIDTRAHVQHLLILTSVGDRVSAMDF